VLADAAHLHVARGVDSAAAAKLGASPATTQELARNYQLANQIKASGTPAFVVGDQVFQGAVGYEALKQAIADARARG